LFLLYFIQIVSGGDIRFAHSYLQRWGWLNRDVIISDETDKYNNYLYICGAMSATSHNNPGTGDFSCARTMSANYRIFTFGSSAFQAYMSHWASGNQYFYDRRFATSVAYPNQTFVKTNTAPALLILNYFDWTERNTY
jgi:hypothetical protein